MIESATTLVVIGDSLTEHGAWPQLLSDQAGWSLQREGRSGQTSWEIALRVGGRPIALSEDEPLPDGSVRVRPELVPGAVREHVDEGMDDIRVRGSVDGFPGLLIHRVSASASDGWSFHPDRPRPPGGASRHLFQPDRLVVPSDAVVVVWCGRNNPGPSVVEDVDAILACLPGDARALVLGLHSAAFEPCQTPGARVIEALNRSLARRHRERFVDVQTALVSAHAVTDGVPAARLRSDDVHLSPEGDAVVARAVRERLLACGWWPPSAVR